MDCCFITIYTLLLVLNEMSKKMIKSRNYHKPIIWEGNLNDDCTAKWAGLMLRAEWMDENYWWWCVYDMLDNQNQIDSSNEYNEQCIGGEAARSEAQDVAKEFLKNELISELKKSSEALDVDKLISELKVIGISAGKSIVVLLKDFDFEYSEAKNKVFESPVWKGLREQS
ncbi:hypothetical protein SAMN06265376_1011060 [Dokdonia pacifica]|uniref:Uncharacterized protein n=2 Tax=Dokdonia pacifica TaxID=1627892 RepID=A0A238WH98_9FLAO|nr:hypothetical protein SAMN06265376_1011060 [Dokdonia pacifica]